MSLLEKVILDSCSLPKFLVMLASMMFDVKTCLAYFLQEELDSSLLEKPPNDGVECNLRALFKHPPKEDGKNEHWVMMSVARVSFTGSHNG